jgi:hypothetical protein
MVPCGKFTCAEYGKVVFNTASRQAVLSIEAERP